MSTAKRRLQLMIIGTNKRLDSPKKKWLFPITRIFFLRNTQIFPHYTTTIIRLVFHLFLSFSIDSVKVSLTLRTLDKDSKSLLGNVHNTILLDVNVKTLFSQGSIAYKSSLISLPKPTTKSSAILS